MTLLLIYLLLLLLLPPTLSTPTGLAASFHSRPAAYGPGEIRTTDLSQTLTPATLGFTYSLSFKFPQTFNSIAIPGEIYPQGHLLTLDTGSTIAARTTLSFLTIYDTPSVNILGYLSLNGPNLLHFHTNSSDWHHVIVSVDFENNTVTHAIDDIVKTETPEVSLREMYTEAMFGDGATGDEETPVYLRLGFDERYGNGWHGLIDNVCVYGEGLSQEEMREVQVSATGGWDRREEREEMRPRRSKHADESDVFTLPPPHTLTYVYVPSGQPNLPPPPLPLDLAHVRLRPRNLAVRVRRCHRLVHRLHIRGD